MIVDIANISLDTECMAMKIKIRKKPRFAKKLTLRKKVDKLKNDEQRGNHPNTRTIEEEKVIREKAYEFFFHKSLRNREALEELGYKDMTDTCFIKRYAVNPNYLTEIVHRDFFKQDYFDYVTNCISKDFASFLIPSLYKGNEKTKAMQILLPDQVGRALTVRKMGLNGETDDAEFRNKFFGLDPSTGEKK